MATSASKTTTDGALLSYALVDIQKHNLSLVSEDAPSLARSFGLGRSNAPEIRIGVGDVLAVTIFESTTGGLFIPNDAGSRPGNYVTLPNQSIDRTGGLSVPYAGELNVLGKTPRQIEKEIEKRLSSRAIEPQAMVTLVTQRSSDVSVVGDVNAPNRFNVQPGGERVLDLIAKAGGLKKEPYQSNVTVQRGGRRATVTFNRLVKDPTENIYLAPGDTIYVSSETKSFVALGALGANKKFDFGSEKLSFAEAVALSGGLLDERANPGEAFVYRIESRRTLREMGVDTDLVAEADDIRTIYRVNLRDPSGLFAARAFPMRDKDVVYVANAPAVEITKILNLIDAVSYTGAATPANAVITRDAIHQLGRSPHP